MGAAVLLILEAVGVICLALYSKLPTLIILILMVLIMLFIVSLPILHFFIPL